MLDEMVKGSLGKVETNMGNTQQSINTLDARLQQMERDARNVPHIEAAAQTHRLKGMCEVVREIKQHK